MKVFHETAKICAWDFSATDGKGLRRFPGVNPGVEFNRVRWSKQGFWNQLDKVGVIVKTK